MAGREPKGLLRVEVHGTLARHFLLPGLPGFLAQYPDIEISMSEGERWVDVIREGDRLRIARSATFPTAT